MLAFAVGLPLARPVAWGTRMAVFAVWLHRFDDEKVGSDWVLDDVSKRGEISARLARFRSVVSVFIDLLVQAKQDSFTSRLH